MVTDVQTFSEPSDPIIPHPLVRGLPIELGSLDPTSGHRRRLLREALLSLGGNSLFLGHSRWVLSVLGGSSSLPLGVRAGSCGGWVGRLR
jgi:hypothetical protein